MLVTALNPHLGYETAASVAKEALATGRSFILVNDHDPKPLYYQLEAEYPKQFGWTYVESGPTVWRVEIAKLAKAA